MFGIVVELLDTELRHVSLNMQLYAPHFNLNPRSAGDLTGFWLP
jgi:hypothetical protein